MSLLLSPQSSHCYSRETNGEISRKGREFSRSIHAYLKWINNDANERRINSYLSGSIGCWLLHAHSYNDWIVSIWSTGIRVERWSSFCRYRTCYPPIFVSPSACYCLFLWVDIFCEQVYSLHYWCVELSLTCICQQYCLIVFNLNCCLYQHCILRMWTAIIQLYH